MLNMVSTILIDFRLPAVPSEADIMEQIVGYQYKRIIYTQPPGINRF